MKQKEPLDLSLRLFEEMQMPQHGQTHFINSDFGFIKNLNQTKTFLTDGQLYRIIGARIILVRQGSAHVSLNLLEHQPQSNHLFLVPPDSIAQLIKVSPDFEAQMIAFNSDFLLRTDGENFSELFFQQYPQSLLLLTAEEWILIQDFFTLIWNIVRNKEFHKEVVQHLLEGLLHHIEHIARPQNQSGSNCMTRREEIFRRFISLANAHSRTERNVAFYADKLCLTPRYLNTVIRQTSGQTVMEWINRSVTLKAKVLLKHSNYVIYQVSDELNFPNPSFFCKFFKRMTGMTPLEYRKSK